jgi:photosystem II stability/assembly factor-like uncharacterized protein
MKLAPRFLLAALALLVAAQPAAAQAPLTLDSTLLAGFRWRSIGPANMAGRVTDVEGIPSPSKTFFMATASGGIWKTTNNGTTFRPVFDDHRVVSMGDMAIAPSDTMQVWAGTGEEDARNSISPGGGIYKSTDVGQTWELMGLEATEHIGRIVVHPTNPDIVWVAASGAVWRENPERGLYKTTDGGRTWQLKKFISNRAGFIDVAISPANPNVLLASSWERIRGPYFLQSGGPGSALWRSEDGGETWTEVTGGGFPSTNKGRIGIGFSQSNPRIVYTMVEAEGENEDGERLTGLWRSDDGGETWQQMNTTNSRPFYYSQIRVDPEDPDRVYFSSFSFSTDGGRTVRPAALEVHVDNHAQWIDPNDPNRFITGNDGGIAITFDRGGNYIFPNAIPLGQFYAASYDMGTPYRVCGGLQDNYSWCGPSRKSSGSITNHDWFRLGGGDGFYTAQDPRDPDIVYSESQGGNMRRMDLRSGQSVNLQKPNWRDVYRPWRDSIALIWPDTTQQPSSAVRTRVQEFRRRAAEDSAAYDLRYNWNTPFFLSPHDPDVFYAGASRVLKSTRRGDGLVSISPDLSRGDTMKIRISTQVTGGITPDVTGAETFATIVALAESPIRRGMLFAGTDDGNVWISPDDGGTWNDITSRFAGVPDGTYVSRIEPSSHDVNRFYITFDNHRRGDFAPYVYSTQDGGQTFRSISSNLPTGKPDFVYVIREDPVNPDLLFVGTDVGAYVSFDRGGSWQKFMNGLPTVPVNDLKIHPRDHELIAATHGRSIWIVDIAPLQQLNAQVVASAAHLFEPKPGVQFGEQPTGGEFTAQLYFEADSPPYGAEIAYWVGQPVANEQASVLVTNARGDTLGTMTGPAERGLHRVHWNFRGVQPPASPLTASQRRDSVMVERRLANATDSLARAGTPRDRLDEAVRILRGGTAASTGGGRGGGDQAATGFVERPAEGPARGGGGGGRGGPGGPAGGRAGGAGDSGTPQQLAVQIAQLVQPPGAGGRGRGGRGGGGGSPFPTGDRPPTPWADPGQYTVTLRIGDRVMTQQLEVIRGRTAPAS